MSKDPSFFIFSLFLAHSESDLSRNICIEINNYVHDKIKRRLDDECMTKKLDISKVKDMMVFVKSILSSKPVCHLSEEEIEHLSINILKVTHLILH